MWIEEPAKPNLPHRVLNEAHPKAFALGWIPKCRASQLLVSGPLFAQVAPASGGMLAIRALCTQQHKHAETHLDKDSLACPSLPSDALFNRSLDLIGFGLWPLPAKRAGAWPKNLSLGSLPAHEVCGLKIQWNQTCHTSLPVLGWIPKQRFATYFIHNLHWHMWLQH